MGSAPSRLTASSSSLVASIRAASASTAVRAAFGALVWGCALPGSFLPAGRQASWALGYWLLDPSYPWFLGSKIFIYNHNN